MFRIDTSTASDTLPAPSAAGTPGYFRPGDKQQGVIPTHLDHDWFNTVQEELVAVVLDAGLSLDKTDRAQLLAAINAKLGAIALGGLTDVTITAPADGDVLTYSGGGWVNQANISVAALRKELKINGLLDSLAGGGSIRVLNGVADPLVDLSRIDTGASSGYTHSAGGGYLTTETETTTDQSNDLADWNGATSATYFTFDAGSRAIVGQTLGNNARASIRRNDVISGDFAIEWRHGKSANNAITGVYLASGDADFDPGNGANAYGADIFSNNVVTSTSAWGVLLTAGDSYMAMGEDGDDASALAAGAPLTDVWRLERTGSTFRAYRNGLVFHTFAVESAADVRLMVNTNGDGAGSRWDYIDLIQTGAPQTLSAVTLPMEATGEPAGGLAAMLVEPLEAVVYGTDFLVDLSLDDGATWEAASVAKLYTDLDGLDVVLAELPAFAGSGDQTLRARYRTASAKALRLHGHRFDAEV
ncbi:MAG: hypothetical protein RIB45_17925 [Marivibrio sp.]|uniref:hypothetical protein n=1 Tax=Marivibrio sp. TaxID=2039719 RepID=UPI0032EF93BB